MTTAKIIADSINPAGSRLTTFEVQVPKYMLAQLNTHRTLSRNYESSRAKPFWKVLQQVVEDPYIPSKFGKYNSGMQPAGYFNQNEAMGIIEDWITSAHYAAHQAIDVGYRDDDEGVYSEAHRRLRLTVWDGETLDWFKDNPPQVAKETINRLLEPFMKVTGVISATNWDSLLTTRTAPDAQDDINTLARAIQSGLAENEPTPIKWGEWHVPYSNEDFADAYELAQAVERVARVSYGNLHLESKRPVGDLFRQLQDGRHWSPFEHVAQAGEKGYTSNYHTSWSQYRHILGGF